MRRFTTVLFFTAALFASWLPAIAQPPRASPHETLSKIVDGNRITLVYGRPYSKDPETGKVRKIWGGLVPYGKVWRTGSDEATMLITQQAILLGGSLVPAGAYTLYTQPEAEGGKLIVNKQLGQWGLQYDEKMDLVRVPLKREPIDAAIAQFTIVIDKNDEGTIGTLKLMWAKTQFTVPFTVKR